MGSELTSGYFFKGGGLTFSVIFYSLTSLLIY